MLIQNAEIADILDDIGSLLEIEDASPFRIRAYKNAAESIRFLTPAVTEMVAAGDDLTKLQGIGPAIAKKIDEIVRTGRLAYLDRIARDSSPGLLALLRVPGLGPKRVRLLRDGLNITSVEELRAAAEAGRLRTAPGFGVATEEGILQELKKMAAETD